MKNVVLLGTNHSIQRGKIQKNSFKSYIKHLCTEHNIKAIAEEIDNKDTYIAQTISKELKIKYKIIEPTLDEKQVLEIKEEDNIIYELINMYNIKNWDEQYKNNDLPPKALEEYGKRLEKTYRQREDEWLKRIDKLDTWPLLVICGDAHSQPFCKLLNSSNIDVIKKYKYKV
jgi:thymidylate synthase